MSKSFKIRNEQKSAPFQSDLVGCHEFSVNNPGTTRVRFRLQGDGGEITLEPGESVAFNAGENIPFARDVIDGSFEKLTAEELGIDPTEYANFKHINLCRISKKIGSDECPY